MSGDLTLTSAVLRLYFAIAVSDSELHDDEAGMIVDQASQIARKVKAAPIPSKEEVEQILGSYLIDFARNQGKHDEPFPLHIIDEAISFIEEAELRSSVLTQMLAIALADGIVHNNELYLLKHISSKWDMHDEFTEFHRLVSKIFFDPAI
jgi:hypothetical protein